jgi:hypothetical protein
VGQIEGSEQEHLLEPGDSLNDSAPPHPEREQTASYSAKTSSSGPTPGEQPRVAGFPSPPPRAPTPAAESRVSRHDSRRTNGNGQGPLPEDEEYFDSWADMFRFSREHLVVDRRRYEAMIYELGKLGAWQEFFKKQNRENKGLRDKIESQWNRELEFFRQLASKNDKKGWRKW